MVPKRLAAAAHFLRAFAITGVHWVYATTSEVEGAYISLKDEDPDIRSQAPVGSSGRAALVVAQSQRPEYARNGLTPGHQRQKLLPVKSGHSGVAQRRRQLPYSIEYRRTSMASCPSSTALLAS